MNKNPECCGSYCLTKNGEVRLYPLGRLSPLGGGATLTLCRACWDHENKYRLIRRDTERWPLIDWDTGRTKGQCKCGSSELEQLVNDSQVIKHLLSIFDRKCDRPYLRDIADAQDRLRAIQDWLIKQMADERRQKQNRYYCSCIYCHKEWRAIDFDGALHKFLCSEISKD